MPIFAGLVMALCNGFVSIFGTFLAMKTAVKLAAFAALITLVTAFLVTVYICLSSLHSMIAGMLTGGGGSGWVSAFFMGVGMFIPANAGAVIACIGSVWIATSIYKFQRDAVLSFGQ